jgi:RNA polymerase sigma-70 factor (ECF subfamily)
MTNDQIISRAQTGDRQAFAMLFDQYKNLVYRSAYLILGNVHDAEDALQDVFLLVYKALAGFDPHKGAFTTWIYRITINYCLNHRRKWGSMPVHLDQVILKAEFPEKQLAEDESVWQAICGLSEKQRIVVVLRYYWELSYAEIAQILEIPLGTVKSRLDVALRTLGRALERQENCPASVDAEVSHEL